MITIIYIYTRACARVILLCADSITCNIIVIYINGRHKQAIEKGDRYDRQQCARVKKENREMGLGPMHAMAFRER